MSLSIRTIISKRVYNKNIQYNNRLTQFTTPPINEGDLYVNRDLYVGRHTYLNNLDICGNLNVSGTIYARQYLPGQVINIEMLNNTQINQQRIERTGSLTNINIFSYSYTPKNSNSYIIIEYTTIYYFNGANGENITGKLCIDGSSNQISKTYQQWIAGIGGGSRSGAIFPIIGRYTNTNTLAKTISVNIDFNTDGDSITIDSNESTWLKITEIGR